MGIGKALLLAGMSLDHQQKHDNGQHEAGDQAELLTDDRELPLPPPEPTPTPGLRRVESRGVEKREFLAAPPPGRGKGKTSMEPRSTEFP